MQTNILGPKNAPYVNTLTDLDELTKKETAILLACVQDYYEETIHRFALALSEPHGEDELAFLACVLTQFYHKVEIDLPEILLKVANMEIEIVEETTGLIRLFLLQIDKGFRGIETESIPEEVQLLSDKRKAQARKEIDSLNVQDLEKLRYAILADELCNHTAYTKALALFKLAEEIQSDHDFIDAGKRRTAEIFAEAYHVGALLKEISKELPETERELLDLMHKVIPLRILESQARRRKERAEKGK
ncbi:hypothetical protein [Portibacter lacus]|uniref:Uncharacterized protein n=1 Tax=Portibacter lacus TaxID=1099794 RepID=A0AA37SK46_9BACT|nr:hypothetical protein [Portibacter lacus]GLR16028.1 hypothetical protein GCM10007940_06430 [Portibacter lacus]